MSEKTDRDLTPLDPKIAVDWATVEARRADLDSRDGGDTRRQTILAQLRFAQAIGFARAAGQTK